MSEGVRPAKRAAEGPPPSLARERRKTQTQKTGTRCDAQPAQRASEQRAGGPQGASGPRPGSTPRNRTHALSFRPRGEERSTRRGAPTPAELATSTPEPKHASRGDQWPTSRATDRPGANALSEANPEGAAPEGSRGEERSDERGGAWAFRRSAFGDRVRPSIATTTDDFDAGYNRGFAAFPAGYRCVFVRLSFAWAPGWFVWYWSCMMDRVDVVSSDDWRSHSNKSNTFRITIRVLRFVRTTRTQRPPVLACGCFNEGLAK